MNFWKGIWTLKGSILPLNSFNMWKVRGKGTNLTAGIAALVLLTLLSLILCLIILRESLTCYKFCKPELSSIVPSLYLALASDQCAMSTCCSARTAQVRLFWQYGNRVFTLEWIQWVQSLYFGFPFDIISLITFHWSVFPGTVSSKSTLAYLVGLLFTILLNLGEGSHEEIYSITREETYVHLGQKRSDKWEYNWGGKRI